MKPDAWDTLKLEWTTPENENNNSGIPVGNGYFGGKIKGGIQRNSSISATSRFGPRARPKTRIPSARRCSPSCASCSLLAAADLLGADKVARKMWGSGAAGDYTPIGKLILTFDHGDTATKYHRELDLDRSLATVRYTIGNVTYTRETFTSFPGRVIVVRLASSAPGKLNFTATMEYPKQMEGHGASVAAEGNNVLVMVGWDPSATGWDPVKSMKAESRLGIVSKGGGVAGQGKALRVEGAAAPFSITWTQRASTASTSSPEPTASTPPRSPRNFWRRQP